ncbi:MAG: hypothetical protein HXS54_08165 [Theionarchaea archaeon]|nr:hypothetical protein [Theionarchaea archaeon]
MIKACSELYPDKTIFEGVLYSNVVRTRDRFLTPAYILDSPQLHSSSGFILMSVMLKETSSLIRYSVEGLH